MVEQATDNLTAAGVGESVAIVTADAGHLSRANVALEDELGVEPLIVTRATKGAGMRRKGSRGRTPKGPSHT
jgi:hypothetical protein